MVAPAPLAPSLPSPPLTFGGAAAGAHASARPHRIPTRVPRLPEPPIPPELELARVLAEPAGPADGCGQLDSLGAGRERGGGDAPPQPLGGAVGAVAVGVREHHQEL